VTRIPSRRQLDAWFPTFVRYVGIVAAIDGIFLDHAHSPVILPAATGMILFKTVVGDGSKE
jgi:hypothetical protein